MLNIAVCDDEAVTLDYLTREIGALFRSHGLECIVEPFQHGTLLRKKIMTTHSYDVLFLDIDMPDVNGIDLGRHLREQQNDSLIVFISNREEYVYQSLKVKPFRFVRKSRFDAEIGQVVQDIVHELSREKPHDIVLTINKTFVSLDPFKIIYVECTNKTLSIVMENEKLEITYKLADLEEMLKGYACPITEPGSIMTIRRE